MGLKKKIRVLVVDDSMLFRETLASRLAEDFDIEVVGTAADPFLARDKILDLEPDVLTLDVEMPKMDGIEFLKKLMPQYPLPVVVVSSVKSNVFDALDAGAVDFVSKPDVKKAGGLDSFVNELIIKIKIASTAKMGHFKKDYVPVSAAKPSSKSSGANRVIVIGASTGGTEAIYEVVKAFPRDMPGVVIVQHMPPIFTRMYAERLNNSCMMEVKEAANGDDIIPGRVLIAPGDYQMRMRKVGARLFVECYKGEKVNGHCPAVDVLFDSAAEVLGPQAIGVILTGMGYDGAKGILNMRRKGAFTVGQDEASSIVYGMPKAAYDLGGLALQAPLSEIANIISRN